MESTNGKMEESTMACGPTGSKMEWASTPTLKAKLNLEGGQKAKCKIGSQKANSKRIQNRRTRAKEIKVSEYDFYLQNLCF